MLFGCVRQQKSVFIARFMVENTGLAGAPPGIWDARILDLFGTLAQSVRFLCVLEYQR